MLHAVLSMLILFSVATDSEQPNPTLKQKVIELPSVRIDLIERNIKVDSEILAVEMPLEFYLVAKGGPDHESVLRTSAKPSSIHAGLIALGLEPGSPARYSETTHTTTAPFGPPLRLRVEWTDADGKLQSKPAEALIRSVKDKTPMPEGVFIFTGSRLREDGAYMADLAGYVVSIVNFDITPIDVPRIASSANETLEWEYNPDIGLKRGDKVTLIIEPVGDVQPKLDDEEKEVVPSDVGDAIEKQDDNSPSDIAALRDLWRAEVIPHADEMKSAAATHYKVISELRKRQQALIEEADKLQRLIDELEREYETLTTPRPSTQPN